MGHEGAQRGTKGLGTGWALGDWALAGAYKLSTSIAKKRPADGEHCGQERQRKRRGGRCLKARGVDLDANLVASGGFVCIQRTLAC